jgi:16S rRNA (uracil1498-N3)-methyltransferase
MGRPDRQDGGMAVLNRFYVDKSKIQGEWVRITGEDVKHITKVLRLSPGDPVVICDGDNTDYEGVIERTGKDEIKVRLGNASRSGTEAAMEMVLYQAIAKGTKMELIIQKGTELGVAAFVPVITSRTVVRLEGRNDTPKKLQRWQRIAMEASKQSGRGRIPDVRSPMDFDQALEEMTGYSLALLPHAGEGGLTIDAIPGGVGDYADIAVMVGPEGGFSDDEIKRARDRGIEIVSMGPRTLRTETAGMVIAAILMYRFGDLGGRA